MIAGAASYSTRRRYENQTDDGSESLLRTRRFMMHLGIWFTAGFLLFILAGTTSTFLLHSCDL